ncbi:hypothetical protein D1AOALGA4SA_13159 [Olavius algarvensis Delta 1 endosymbiont]|nr:hypothetical protein D1AOALGA4SA_13159 [Olavius algarvensis Delta 1 endosymbiont]
MGTVFLSLLPICNKLKLLNKNTFQKPFQSDFDHDMHPSLRFFPLSFAVRLQITTSISSVSGGWQD